MKGSLINNYKIVKSDKRNTLNQFESPIKNCGCVSVCGEFLKSKLVLTVQHPEILLKLK